MDLGRRVGENPPRPLLLAMIMFVALVMLHDFCRDEEGAHKGTYYYVPLVVISRVMISKRKYLAREANLLCRHIQIFKCFFVLRVRVLMEKRVCFVCGLSCCKNMIRVVLPTRDLSYPVAWKVLELALELCRYIVSSVVELPGVNTETDVTPFHLLIIHFFLAYGLPVIPERAPYVSYFFTESNR